MKQLKSTTVFATLTIFFEKKIMTVVMFAIFLKRIHNRLIHLTWPPSPGSSCQRKETLAVQDKIENVILLTEMTTTITQNPN